MTGIKSINDLLEMNLDIPDYQRPYKWSVQNIQDLLTDITNAIQDAEKYNNFKYRIGTIILHENNGQDCFDIVDGQQRVISLLLLKLYLDSNFECAILKKNFTNKITKANIHRNYRFIREWFSSSSGDDTKAAFRRALSDILQVVVVSVKNISEAFQFFDSQNTRGKDLDPHDLLKAYHLREMKDSPSEMKHTVTDWEAHDTAHIRELFNGYLFPIMNWSRCTKNRKFTPKEIDTYKGISKSSTYTYAKRACSAMPFFQITEPFIAGKDFFDMVGHYLNLLNYVKTEICTKSELEEIKKIICGEKNDVSTPQELDKVKFSSVGLKYAVNLFYSVLLCYYDKFNYFDTTVVKKLFVWAMMVRIDMKNLGYSSINKYAIGEDNGSYTNAVPMFSKIRFARMHHEISGIQIEVNRKDGVAADSNWQRLYEDLQNLMGVEVSDEQSGNKA